MFMVSLGVDIWTVSSCSGLPASSTTIVYASYTKTGGFARGFALELSCPLLSASASPVGVSRIVKSLPRPGRISAVISHAR